MSQNELHCFKCGRECDIWTEADYDEHVEKYYGYCDECMNADDAIVQKMRDTIREHLERAYARIPKKKRVAA
jgi:hypothetical protein